MCFGKQYHYEFHALVVKAGMEISLDNYCTGCLSLSHLVRKEVDYIKN